MNRRILEGLRLFVLAFVTFFLVIGFVVTCSFLLFFDSIELPMEHLPRAAKLTFVNVLVISLIFVAADLLRRKLTIERPVRIITDAMEQIMQGDFTVRLNPTGEFSGFAEIMQNINRMTQELSGLETLRTDFISNVSHEMKSPLAVMQNYCTLLQAPNLTEQERLEYADLVSRECGRLANLVSNVLRLNKLENQQIFSTGESYNLSEQLCQCLLQFEQIWEEKGLDLAVELPDSITIRGDRELLAIVWNNLLSNAFKFTDRGMVSLVLTADDTYATVAVSDTGCGMSPHTGRHIFEKFYQGDTSHATAGNGLGLALVKRIMDITGGEITVTSTAGLGSTFTVRLRR